MYIKNFKKKCKKNPEIKPLNQLIKEIEDFIKNSENNHIFHIKKPIWSK